MERVLKEEEITEVAVQAPAAARKCQEGQGLESGRIWERHDFSRATETPQTQGLSP